MAPKALGDIELDMQGPLRMAEVVAAQDMILDIVRKLETAGDIVLSDGDDEMSNLVHSINI